MNEIVPVVLEGIIHQTFTHDDYRVGSIIEYKTFTGDSRKIRVTNKQEDIKNGKGGFDGLMMHVANMYVWGYDEQITAVVKY